MPPMKKDALKNRPLPKRRVKGKHADAAARRKKATVQSAQPVAEPVGHSTVMGSEATMTKWGNSVGLVIPAPMREKIGLIAGSTVRVSVIGEDIVIRKAVVRQQRPRRPWSEIIKNLTPRSHLDGWDDTTPVGKEIA